jgi:hypothetical protein
MISVTGLAEAFFKGVDRFIIETCGNPSRRGVVMERLHKLVDTMPF